MKKLNGNKLGTARGLAPARRSKKKQFVLESRNSPAAMARMRRWGCGFCLESWGHWHTWRRYASAEQRQQALEVLVHKPTRTREFRVAFEPTDIFVRWLTAWDRPVIDCGCGLSQLGTHVVAEDAVAFDFPPKCLAVIARPTRGDWIHATMERTRECGARMVYVGLPAHVEEDVWDSRFQWQQIVLEAGTAGEQVYLLTGDK